MEQSKIAWTTNTFNGWIGCTKVGPGCDHCYAEAFDARYRGEGTGASPHWGPGAPRRRTGIKTWNMPLRWQRERRAQIAQGLSPDRTWVFASSLCDVFDNEVDPSWRSDLWSLVDLCPDLSWQFVTKRVGNVAKMLPASGRLPENSILLITAVNQEEVDRDVPKLLALKDAGRASWVGVSYEPALGPVDWAPWVDGRKKLDWIIVGGESRQGPTRPARPFCLEWASEAVRIGRKAGVAVFIKQMGDQATLRGQPFLGANGKPLVRAGTDPDQWPQALRVRDFPGLPM